MKRNHGLSMTKYHSYLYRVQSILLSRDFHMKSSKIKKNISFFTLISITVLYEYCMNLMHTETKYIYKAPKCYQLKPVILNKNKYKRKQKVNAQDIIYILLKSNSITSKFPKLQTKQSNM